MKYDKFIFILLFFIGIGISCEESVLDEVPKDFLTPSNAYTNKGAFESSLASIYKDIRNNIICREGNVRNPLLGCDVDLFSSTTNIDPYLNIMYWSTMNADNSMVIRWWSTLYNLVLQANTIINRADGEQVTWSSEEEKNAIVGTAKFLRAFAYRTLANMFGGVPIVLEETSGAKFDYTRATQAEVYNLCKEDLEFAVKWMKTVDELKGGMAPRAAAYHLLAEIYICMGDYDAAINAASAVIDDPNFYLMTERFGKLKDFTWNGYDYRGEYEPWGDVYWDLFREGNLNWIDGNHEAIWNIQLEYNQIGGEANFQSESIGPGWWAFPDKNGVQNFQKDTLCGRPNDGCTITDYFNETIWQYKDDWDRDMRNSEYNIQRTYYWLNPQSEFYGQPITNDNIAAGQRPRHVPRPMKTVTALHHGAGYSSIGQPHDWGSTYKDWYLMRLPETYLLRAEAYFLKGDNSSAADDINVVRNRAHATPVINSEVNLDLILDERARELFAEEFRLNTLMRMGKLVEYLNKYNQGAIMNGWTLDDHLNKLPIPNSEIEANTEAELEQNPGY